MTDKATVDFIADAKLGDLLWHYDAQRANYKEYEARKWMSENKWKLVKRLENCRNIDQLKKIVEILGGVE